jgi:DNA-binding NarL/FixJ family response regulator
MTILLVDDHQIFREGVCDILTKEEFCTSVSQASGVADARESISQSPPDLVVTDLSLPDEPGQNLIRWVAKEYPDVRTLCMTMHSEVAVMREVFSAGARGFVTKQSGYKELIDGIRRVAAGELYVDQVMLSRIIDYLGRGQDLEGDPGGPLGELSQREREVFFLLLEDKEVADIAEALFISTKTVENHRTSIYRKLGVRDRLSLFQFARTQGCLE